ncbi:MAG: hypothetical protein COA78_23015 [Blastopirellula sp.]|nr:MAG: hypothetical protein COA78_23015 [Blastopirellula sp.]
MSKSQEKRFFELVEPQGDKLLLRSFTGHEEISQLFSFELELESAEIPKPEQLIYKPAILRLSLGDEKNRLIKGYINRFSRDYSAASNALFRVEMVPWLWFLTQTSDCRIFEDQSIPEIIEAVFKSEPIKNIAKHQFKLSGNYPKLEYCVQYRETDFNFISRLMEQAGICYFFNQEPEGSTKIGTNSDELIITDDLQSAYDLAQKKMSFKPITSVSGVDDDITDWKHRYEFVSGAWSHTDFNFLNPYQSLETPTDTQISNPLSSTFKKYELYDYPGLYLDSKAGANDKKQGDAIADVRIGEEETDFDQIKGAGVRTEFLAGGLFELHSPDKVVEDHGKKFIITSVQHTGSNAGYISGSGLTPGYSNSFQCIPQGVEYRPARVTPKPMVYGAQTATVVGEGDEEIECDEHGRVKVLFHWARPENKSRTKPEDQISCWIRVAHNSAGKKWGFMSIPRVGQEVVVEFLNGDPDRPLIVGSVYNKTQEPHYKLPDEKARTYFKTNSTPDGKGFNELMFDDKADQELLFMHAQKDMDVRVRSNSTTRIYGNRSQIIGWEKDGDKGGSQHEMIYQDKDINVKRNQQEHIEGNQSIMIGNGEAEAGGNLALVVEKSIAVSVGQPGVDMAIEGDSKTKIDGSQSLTIAGDSKSDVGSSHLTVSGVSATKTGGNLSFDSGKDIHTKAASKIAFEAGMEIHLKSGMKLVLESALDISLKVGGNFINIGPAGISIQGILVNINSGGAAQSGSGVQVESPLTPDLPADEVVEAKPSTPLMAHKEETGFKSLPDS